MKTRRASRRKPDVFECSTSGLRPDARQKMFLFPLAWFFTTRRCFMRLLGLLSALALFLLSYSGLDAGDNKPPPGFTPLFNGKDFTGWKVPAGDNGHWRILKGDIID